MAAFLGEDPDTLPCADPVAFLGGPEIEVDEKPEKPISSFIARFGLPFDNADTVTAADSPAEDEGYFPPGANMWPGYWPQTWEQHWHMQQAMAAYYWGGMPPPEPTAKQSEALLSQALRSLPTKEQKRVMPANNSKDPKGLFHKTVLCSFFPQGLCKKGKACPFAHGGDELEQAPDLAKTALCVAWKKGVCPNTALSCPFAHGKQDLRNAEGKKDGPKPASRSKNDPRPGKANDVLDLLNRAQSKFEKENGHKSEELDTDELLLMMLEEREGKEGGFDDWNEETFGAGLADDWDYAQRMPGRDEQLPIPPPPPSPPPPGLCDGSNVKRAVPPPPPPPGLGNDEYAKQVPLGQALTSDSVTTCADSDEVSDSDSHSSQPEHVKHFLSTEIYGATF